MTAALDRGFVKSSMADFRGVLEPIARVDMGALQAVIRGRFLMGSLRRGAMCVFTQLRPIAIARAARRPTTSIGNRRQWKATA